MATAAQQQSFITAIAPLIQAEAKARGYKVASPIIAQACIESAYGLSSLGKKYHNYFGMKCGSSWKGKSVNLKTKEEYTAGTLTTIRDNFRAYSSMEEGVKGYFDFISSKRYANLKTADTPRRYLEMIKADGYATASGYVQTNMGVVERHGLAGYDLFPDAAGTASAGPAPSPVAAEVKKTVSELAKEVIQGKWGNGVERKNKLIAAGYDWQEVQREVNRILKAR
ncbi:MAG: glucosaminidase domain-containing protein [Clostridia bacterium]|nr:glucosaminidase domain-containing protein [Clostridia bacterium]